MKSFKTSVEIAAPPSRVWQVLTQDMPRDPVPYGILKIDGTVQAGGRIKLWSEVSPNRAFALKVAAFEPSSRMVWRGGMPLGLFTGTRTFKLSAAGAGTLFQMEELFTGAMSGMITKSMPDLTPSFEKFAQALKERAERDD